MASVQKKFKAILFDLDGTLLDTLDDLADSMNQALSQLGFTTHPVKAYKYFVGDGAEIMAKRALPQNHREPPTIEKCITIMKQKYNERWTVNTKPYLGITDLLDSLQAHNFPMAILSNKPDDFTQKMTAELLADYQFRIVRGARNGVPAKPNPDAALQIADQIRISPSQFMYLGDTDTDMKTATAAGMFPAGALWGFRTAEELKANGAAILVEQPIEVLDFFLTKKEDIT